MAEPTFLKRVSRGITAWLGGSVKGTGEDVLTTYGYQNYVPLKDKAGNEVHLILGTGAPSAAATYDSAPLGSLYLNYAGGDGTCGYFKEATGATGWAPITTGSQA